MVIRSGKGGANVFHGMSDLDMLALREILLILLHFGHFNTSISPFVVVTAGALCGALHVVVHGRPGGHIVRVMA